MKAGMALWAMMALGAALSLGSALDGAAAQPGQDLSRRWLFVMRSMRTQEEVERTIGLFPRAAAAGYNAIVLSDGALLSPAIEDPAYRANVLRVQEAARAHGLDLIPCVMHVGYGGSVLGYDPNLAEGFPVKHALFVAEGREARLVADPPVGIRNGGFEEAEGHRFLGWDMQDSVGTGSFADREVRHGGAQSVRMENIAQAEPRWGHSRLMQVIKVRPFRQYHLWAWVRTEDFEATESVRMLVLAPTEKERALGDLAVRVKRTQDWTRYELLFNSLSFEEVRVYIGAWGGRNGRLWWDDVELEEIGALNVLRRDGCPITVKGEDGTIYEEGRDYEELRDPQLRAYPTIHQPVPIRLTRGSRIREGARLRVSYYHALATPSDQVMFCLSEPKVYEILREQVRQVNELLHPRAFFMQHDEIRIANWDYACQRRGLTPGQMLADNVRQCVQMIRDLRPEAEIWVWSDMFDPMHNAVGDYYAVNGTWAGSWEGLDPKVGIVNWYGELKGKNAPFFAARGHQQVLAGYYDWDEQGTGIRDWLAQTRGVAGVVGAMYTTWQDKYQALERWAEAAWGGAGEGSAR